MFPKLYHQSWINDNISIDTMKKFNIRYYPVTLNRKTPYYSATVCANSEEEAKDIAIKLYKKYQTEVFS